MSAPGGIRAFSFTTADGVPPSVAPFAHATAAGPTLHVTGQMPTGLDGHLVSGGIADQTDRVMANLSRVVELAGGVLADCVQARAYLLHWTDYAEFNAAYEKWFPERLPSRTCVGTNGLAAGALVEVDLVCWRAAGWPGR